MVSEGLGPTGPGMAGPSGIANPGVTEYVAAVVNVGRIVRHHEAVDGRRPGGVESRSSISTSRHRRQVVGPPSRSWRRPSPAIHEIVSLCWRVVYLDPSFVSSVCLMDVYTDRVGICVVVSLSPLRGNPRATAEELRVRKASRRRRRSGAVGDGWPGECRAASSGHRWSILPQSPINGLRKRVRREPDAPGLLLPICPRRSS